MHRLLTLALSGLTLVACTRATDPSAGTIVYVKGSEVRSVQPDGSNDIVLAAIGEERTIRDMAVDAKGEQIAFVDDSMMQGGAPPQIVVMNADGTGRHVAIDASELPDKTWNVWEIAWSPRGDELALCLEGGSVVAAIDGSSIRPVGTANFCVSDWSDDGSRLLGTVRGVVEMDTDGSNRRLLSDQRAAKDPTWSPDGTQILYQAGRQGDVLLARSDGTESHSLGLPSWSDVAWSPDGSEVVFVQGDDLSMNTMNLSDDDASQVLPARPPDNGYPELPSWLL